MLPSPHFALAIPGAAYAHYTYLLPASAFAGTLACRALAEPVLCLRPCRALAESMPRLHALCLGYLRRCLCALCALAACLCSLESTCALLLQLLPTRATRACYLPSRCFRASLEFCLSCALLRALPSPLHATARACLVAAARPRCSFTRCASFLLGFVT